MFANGIDIKKFNATVSKKLIQPSKIDKDEISKSITIKILFEGKTRDEIYENISKFNELFLDEATIKFKNLSNYFKGKIRDSSIEDTELDEWLYLNIEFECKALGSEIIENLNRVNTKTINVLGTYKTNAIVEITPRIDLVDLRLDGLANDPIIIKNLKQGKKIIIDGKEGTVLEEGINKFKDTDLWEFPFLVPGTNTITLSKNSCDVVIKYEPRYL
ncbi:MAG: phage tail family protein [Clostridium perfringens]|nr:phage tail family protein [Clostridium perfringens]